MKLRELPSNKIDSLSAFREMNLSIALPSPSDPYMAIVPPICVKAPHFERLLQSDQLAHYCMSKKGPAAWLMLDKKSPNLVKLRVLAGLRGMLPLLIDIQGTSTDGYIVNRRIESLLELLKTIDPEVLAQLAIAKDKSIYEKDEAQALVQVIKRIHETLYSIGQSEVFRQDVKNKKLTFKKNLESLQNYVDGLFDYYTRLWIIRLDFYLKRDEDPFALLYDEENLQGFVHSPEKLDQLIYYLNRYFENRRHNTLLMNIKGYVIKIEHGLKRGFHAHCLIFIDADVHHQSSFITDEFAKYWCQLTQGQGFCNIPLFKKEKYKNPFLDKPIHVNDITTRFNIDVYLNYICKTDQAFIFQPLKNIRQLRRGQVPVRKSNRGRPRIIPRISMQRSNQGVRHG